MPTAFCNGVLRITNIEDKWVLQGQLTGPWADELLAAWRSACGSKSSKCVVDLTGVTFVDEAGALVLCEMNEAGVKFIASGVDTKYLLDEMKRKAKPPLRRCLSCLRTEKK